MKIRLLLLFSWCVTGLHAQFVPGKSYFGEHEYIEYIAGNMPFILAAPHGGNLKPESIPDRDCDGCVYVKDSYTQELIREIAADFTNKTGCHPHIIINRLHRTKLDANRDIGDAADSDPIAETAWEEFHDFIEIAKKKAEANFGKGLFLDLHGHGHDIQRVELGYLLTGSDLRKTDDELNAPNFHKKSSVSHLFANSNAGISFSELIRGELSLGSFMEEYDARAVPSGNDPFPEQGDPFFSGGYNTRRHGSRDSTRIDAIQIECNRDIRFDADEREAFAQNLTSALIDFYTNHWSGDDISGCESTINSNQISSKEAFKIYPNPTTDFFTFSAPESFVDIKIFDRFGVLQNAFRTRTEQQNFSVKNLTPGLYFLQITKNEAVMDMKKLVIVKD